MGKVKDKEEMTPASEDLVLSLALRQKLSDSSKKLEDVIGSFHKRLDETEKKLTIAERKFDQIQEHMDFYEKWYVDLVERTNSAVEEMRRFLGKYTKDDLEHLERIINAIHDE